MAEAEVRKHVLTLSRDYFRLRKPLDRRIYELSHALVLPVANSLIC